MAARLAICIPTRDRAALLAQCLDHLRGFRLPLEVVVTDNASSDDTPRVVRAFAKTFERFVYHRHERDIGPARNMDSALRLATAPYLWVLSDDDIAYESALAFLTGCLDTHPAAVAACGRYNAAHGMHPGADRFEAPTQATVLPRGDIGVLAANVLVCDSHPVMRRDVFQRHCRMEDRGFGLFPLYAALLRHGDVLYIDRPIMDHLANAESLSTRMTEHWFADFAVADIELAMARARPALPLGTVELAKNEVQGRLYLQAARMARMHADPLLMRHFLLRARAIGMIDDSTLVQWESTFLLDAALQRLAQLIEDLGVRRVRTTSAFPEALAERLQVNLPALRIVPDGADATLAWQHGEPGAGVPPPPLLCFLDVLESCRVTEFAVNVDPAGDGGLEFADPAAQSLLDRQTEAFYLLMADYGART